MWQEVGDWVLVCSLLPNLPAYPEQFSCPRSSGCGFGSIREPQTWLRHHCFLQDTYSGGRAMWGATQDGRVRLGSQAGVSKADEGEDWFVGTYWASFGGLSEFAGAQLGWVFTSHVLWAFPSFRCYNHCLEYYENFLRNLFPPRHAEVTSHESMGETQGSSSHAMPPACWPLPQGVLTDIVTPEAMGSLQCPCQSLLQVHTLTCVKWSQRINRTHFFPLGSPENWPFLWILGRLSNQSPSIPRDSNLINPILPWLLCFAASLPFSLQPMLYRRWNNVIPFKVVSL